MSCLIRRRRGAVLEVLLNREAARNAMSAELVAELIATVEAFADDAEARVLLLAGAGKGFCAGSDLSGLAALDAEGRRHFEAESGRVARLLSECPKPVVAAVHGFAIGGGLTLAVAADIVVTERSARWSLPEVPIGLFPAWGLAAVERRAGLAAARRLSWGIDTIDGAEAARLGLADLLVEADPLAAAAGIADRLASLPAAQAEAVKAYFAGRGDDEAADARANDLFMAATRTPEAEASFVRFGKRRK